MKITVLNQKGGVGKSTISVNLSYDLSQKNKKVLLTDIDHQGHSSVIYCPEIPQDSTIKEILLDRKFDIKKSILPAVMSGKKVENLSIIPANIRLAPAAEQIASRIHREKLLHNQLEKVNSDYDYIIIDCPPSLNVLTINAIYTADLILIPTIYGRYSLDGIADLFTSIQEVKEGKNYNYGIVRNMFDPRTKTSNEFIESQLKDSKRNLLDTIIRKTESINQALMNGEIVYTFDPKSNGVTDFESLINELMKMAG